MSFSSGSTVRLSARMVLVVVCLNIVSCFGLQLKVHPLIPAKLEISGSAAPWRFINAVGERAGIWGFENGVLEGWVYPLKLFHDFSLLFQLEGSPTIYPGEQLIRAVRIRPESVELQYSCEQFTIKETLFTPRHEAGFVIWLEAKTPTPLHVLVRFRPDLNLMWPGSIGGQVVVWNRNKNWIELSEPSGKFSAVIGSPAAVGASAVGYHAYLTNNQPYEQIDLRINPRGTQGSQVPIIAAGGISRIYQPAEIYSKILKHLPELYSESVKHYADLDEYVPQIFTPDPAVNSSLRWARVSLDQLKVCNPYLGCGYVSGYGSSGTGTRPMYAWFFDEPDISERVFVENGDADAMREAFRFIQKFQRADGQIPHEISQSAGVIDWFKDYPYPYIHVDTCLWYLIAMGHFYRFTGDREFVTESWSSVQRAYQYCLSLLDKDNGLPVIPPESWGSMETAGVATQDSAMAGEWIAALRAMGTLAAAMHDSGLARECGIRAKLASESLERLFWNPSSGYYNYGVGKAGDKVTYLNPAIAYSAWFGSLPQEHARAVLERLAAAQFLSDWGQRSMSLEDPRYDENSYQVGSAWPFFTVASMLAGYRYHNAIQGFITWMSMTRLRMFNQRGAMPESLSGSYYQLLDNGVPHQMFSELTATPGLIEGVLGLELDVPGRVLQMTPHLPPAWPDVSVRQFPFGQGKLDIELRQVPGRLSAELEGTNVEGAELMFSPGLPAGATAYSVKVQGKPVPFQVEDDRSDIHVRVNTKILAKTSIEVLYRGGVGVDIPWQPLLEGDMSRNLHVLNSSYRNGQFQILVEGRPDSEYEIRLWTPWQITAASSAKSITRDGEWSVLRITAPASAAAQPDKAGFARWSVVVSLQRQ